MSADLHRLDAIWDDYKARRLATIDAVQEIRCNLEVTAEGAQELLASDIPPSVRILRSQAPAWNIRNGGGVILEEELLPTEKAPHVNILERLTNAINGSYTSDRHMRRVTRWEARHPARAHRKGHVPLTQQPRDQH